MLVFHISMSCLWSKHQSYLNSLFKIHQVGPAGPNYFYQAFRNASNFFRDETMLSTFQIMGFWQFLLFVSC